ncbi:hypothetical protein RUM44_011967 [Polyplax serrata]|uniref:Uncharacterized protein n=1 Tax=Polyplax serrata TaxID=468196 RepID=A0ABR1BDT6_POLSC
MSGKVRAMRGTPGTNAASILAILREPKSLFGGKGLNHVSLIEQMYFSAILKGGCIELVTWRKSMWRWVNGEEQHNLSKHNKKSVKFEKSSEFLEEKMERRKTDLIFSFPEIRNLVEAKVKNFECRKYESKRSDYNRP